MLVAFCLFVFFLIVRFTLSVEKPNVAQQLAELIHEFTGSHADQIIGHGYEKYQAFITAVLLFVLFNNLLGLIPGVETPTSAPVVPLGIAACTFLYYNFHGIREQGVVRLPEAPCRPNLVDCVVAVPHRDHFPPGPHHVAHHPSLRQHVRL